MLLEEAVLLATIGRQLVYHVCAPEEIMEELACRLYLDYDVQAITLGGLDRNGNDAVNDLSYIILEATRDLGIVRDLSNLQRQIAHNTKRLGVLKADSAKETYETLNHDVKVVTHKARLTSENIKDIIKDYDIVVDGSDNFPTRYLVNDACVMLKKKLISAAVFRFEGQVMSIYPGEGPCYRCLFEVPPPPGMVPSCQEAGILGVVTGVIGTIQATEVIKAILGIGDPLRGKLLLWNALEMSFRTVKVPRNHECPVCGDKPTITELIDYEWFCSMSH